MKRNVRVVAAVTASAVAITGFGLAQATAVMPAFPVNIEVGVDTDIVAVMGFAERSGQVATVEVTRPGVGLIGSAESVVANTPQIFTNHPSIQVNAVPGVCWGAGGGPQVTPDILPGDTVAVKFNGEVVADQKVADVRVSGLRILPEDPTVVEAYATIGPEVSPTRLDATIVSLGLLGVSSVLRQDVRALVGPVVRARKGFYYSGITMNGNEATARFEFDSAATAKVAAAGELSFSTWERMDAAGNMQGITVADNNNLPAPMLGQCPAAKRDLLPPKPASVELTAIDDTHTKVTWRQGEEIPGTEPVLGFTVRAVGQAIDGSTPEVGVRVTDPTATSAVLPVPMGFGTFEVRSFTAKGESFPPATPNDPKPDNVNPRNSAKPATGTYATMPQVVLLTDEAQTAIYYTLDGSEPYLAGKPTVSANVYSTPIPLPQKQNSVLKYIAVDAAGNTSATRTETYTYQPQGVPSAPLQVSAVGGNASAQVTWQLPVNEGGSPITGYLVSAIKAGADPISVTTGPLEFTTKLTGLVNGTSYRIEVRAINDAGQGAANSAASNVTPTASLADVLTVTSAKWAKGQMILTGTGTVQGAFLSFRTGSFTGPSLASGVMVPGGINGAPGVWTLKLTRGSAPAANPGFLYIVSSKGARLGPVTVVK